MCRSRPPLEPGLLGVRCLAGGGGGAGVDLRSTGERAQRLVALALSKFFGLYFLVWSVHKLLPKDLNSS